MPPEIVASPGPPGVLAELGGTVASAFAALNGFLELASLEGRRAGVAVLWITTFGVGAAICLVSAWFGLLAGAIILGIAAGLPAWASMLAVGAVNGIAGLMLVRAAVGRSDDLRFTATRRQLAAMASPSPGPQP